jgi:uncharacterized protein YndB with AHSA1/START domain
MTKTIRHSFHFPYKPEVVWQYLTVSELISEWLMPNTFKAELGATFQFKTKPLPRFGFDGNVYCKVIELDRPRKLAYTWVGGMPGKDPMLDSVVTWTLESTEQGTLLHLEHAGFRGIKNLFGFMAMNSGWKKIGKRVQQLINEKYHDPAQT